MWGNKKPDTPQAPDQEPKNLQTKSGRMVRTLSWNCGRSGIEMAVLSPGIAILSEHSEWFQPLFAGLDRRGIPYDRLLATDLSYDSRARASQYALVVNRISPSAYRLGAGSANSGSGLTRGETVVAGD